MAEATTTTIKNTFLLEIVTPERLVFSEEVDELMAPGEEGYFGVLPGHTPFISTLKIGELWYRQGKKEKWVAVTWGYAEVLPDKVTILAEAAEMAHEIDIQRAKQKYQEALEALKNRADLEPDYLEKYEASLEKALLRLQIAEKEGKKE